jgi:hypothetical protein
LHVDTGENVAISGFIITGNSPKKVVVRGLGPSLPSAGFSKLADPTIELRNANNSLIASNDNWQDNPAWADELKSKGLAPQNNLESAVVATLVPGTYTATMSGRSNSTGMGLVEVYDLDPTSDSRLANISTRGLVGVGDDVVIGGFILGGDDGNTTVLIRAVGPSLSGAGVKNALANPFLELRDGNGVLLEQNDNWKDRQQNAIEGTGIPPRTDLESAILATLPAGSYTAISAGQGGSSGVGLIEVYNIR